MFSPSELHQQLDTRLALPRDAAVCVAFSGGLDSTVLLHAMARLQRHPLRAVHIDHGLHADSASWSAHCDRQARALGVEFVSQAVSVDHIEALGLEAAARAARYQALSHILRDGEYLLSAHHADDQLETLLLALMRGAGLPGLSAMPAMQPFAKGWLARPLIAFTRAELEQWARAERLTWLSDPSNENLSLDRNFLRRKIIAPLRERWPSTAQTAARSTEHLQAASRLLDQLAALDADGALVGECLDVERLRLLDSERRRNLLRFWIRGRGARATSTRKLIAIEHEMLAAGVDRIPCMEWDGWEVRRHRDLLYCQPCLPDLDLDQRLAWPATSPLALPSALGELRLENSVSGGLSAARIGDSLEVRFRAGGESLLPAGHACHRKLKKLLQAAAILPWWRDRLPLIYARDRLLAVGDLWIEAEFAAREGEPAYSILWQGRPRIESQPRPR
ncbi:MAG: tRNA lysidine(34) synthetase TilS [Steroidobacter sp.]